MLDSKEPSLALEEFLNDETRFSILPRKNPAAAKELFESARLDILHHWEKLQVLKGL
jgi:pyruvate/2-oxoacid:ferredoxin oxidoreductase beta subunit